MVTVKVRETYDLATVKNKMTLIGIHTPKPDIIKRNYPGLLMQCKAYRPKSCDVRIACASVLPLDPRGVGTTTDDVAPEDVFNPILYKAISNFGMSTLEARINHLMTPGVSETLDVDGASAGVEVDEVTNNADEFAVYYGLLADAHGWKHAMPQAGLSMKNLKPYVWEVLYNIADAPNTTGVADTNNYAYPAQDNTKALGLAGSIRGNSKPMPFIPTGTYSAQGVAPGEVADSGDALPYNRMIDTPWLSVVCAAIIIPPSRLHTLYYRMVVEWDIEFTMIRPLQDVSTFGGIGNVGNNTHFQNYSYAATKEIVTGTEESILDNDSCMVSSNVEVNKVM